MAGRNRETHESQLFPVRSRARKEGTRSPRVGTWRWLGLGSGIAFDVSRIPHTAFSRTLLSFQELRVPCFDEDRRSYLLGRTHVFPLVRLEPHRQVLVVEVVPVVARVDDVVLAAARQHALGQSKILRQNVLVALCEERIPAL